MRKFVGIALLAMFMAAPAAAAPLVISNVAGQWQNHADPLTLGVVTTNQGGSLMDQILWGVEPLHVPPISGSGYQFDPTDGNINPVVNVPFLLGLFTHINVPVNDSIQTVEYAFSFATNGIPALVNQTFFYNHNETNNAPCGGNVPGCPDIVTVSNTTLNQLITVGADVYLFELLGFSTDGGVTFSNMFTSPENGNNSAGLYARITNVQVPEPATFLLLGGGALALAFARRRRRA